MYAGSSVSPEPMTLGSPGPSPTGSPYVGLRKGFESSFGTANSPVGASFAPPFLLGNTATNVRNTEGEVIITARLLKKNKTLSFQ